MNPFQRAIVSNNIGVKLLESNDTLLAIAAFQDGIELMKECGEYRNRNQKFEWNVPSAQPVEPECTASHFAGEFNCLPHNLLTTKSFPQEGLYYLHGRPILIPPNLLTSQSQVWQSKLYRISAILLFNLALTCQKHAGETFTSTGMLCAVRMYTLAATVLEHDGGCCDHDAWGKLMICLIFNNLANVYHELCEYNASHYLFRRIKEAVSNDIAIGDFALSFLTEEEWVEMQLNCVYSQIPSAAATA